MDKESVGQKIKQLEQKWGSEVKALKQANPVERIPSLRCRRVWGRISDGSMRRDRMRQDLHRTILAHNHNSDLMRHHRDALEKERPAKDPHVKGISQGT